MDLLNEQFHRLFHAKNESFTSAEKCQKNRNFFFFLASHTTGPSPSILYSVLCDTMRFVVRLFIQACALPVGFACFLKEKTLLICAHLLCEACDTIASFAWVTRITSSNLPQRSSRARAGAPMRPPREEVLHRSPGWRKELSRWRTGT